MRTTEEKKKQKGTEWNFSEIKYHVLYMVGIGTEFYE